jgi:signal transduction histidine kinase
MEISGRLPQGAEVAAYYVVSEALANAAKHAQASIIEVSIRVAGDDLVLQVRDDGVVAQIPLAAPGSSA